MSWTSAAAAPDERREIIERFRPMLALACGLLRWPQILARELNPGVFALVISSNGVPHDLPGHSAGPHLGEGGSLRQLLAQNVRCWMS